MRLIVQNKLFKLYKTYIALEHMLDNTLFKSQHFVQMISDMKCRQKYTMKIPNRVIIWLLMNGHVNFYLTETDLDLSRTRL